MALASKSAKDQKVAFLGLGLMGRPLALRLAKAGFVLSLWNRTAQKAEAFAQVQSRPCQTPRDAAIGADVVCLCLADASAVEAVVFGPNGVAEALSETATLIDFSSIGVDETREYAERLAKRSGAAWLDCPVSGGVAGAESGKLVIMAGGDPDRVARVTPVLHPLALRVTHLGPVGAGQAAKLCNQLIVSANLLALAEAIWLGEALGVNVPRLPTALAGGFADSPLLQIFGPRMAASRDTASRVGKLATLFKDVETIEAAAAGLHLPLLEQVGERLRETISRGWGEEDLPCLMRLYRGAQTDREAKHI